MLKWGWHVYKACKVCNSSREVCKKHVMKYVIKCVKVFYWLQACLQAFYRLFTGFNRDITYFTYFLIKEKEIKKSFGGFL